MGKNIARIFLLDNYFKICLISSALLSLKSSINFGPSVAPTKKGVDCDWASTPSFC